MQVVAWFNEVGRNDVGLVGGKGANLGELTRAGLPVPPGFIVTADAYFQFLRESAIEAGIARLLAGLDVADRALLQQASDGIKQLIGDASVPPEISTEITAAHLRMSQGPVAVRSSATAEDLADASFAGQQSSFLNVNGAAVVDAVQACWASLFETQAIAYREQRAYRHMDVGIAVVVQEMVQSQRSGVMFTMHPVTGDREKIVIESVYGLGEACVSGAVTPDFYVVDKPSLRIEEKTAAHQEQELVRNANVAAGGECNDWIAVAPERGRLQKLSDDEIVTIGELGRRVEEHYGTPQDIEWAEENGEFYIVQTRPITTG
jgi:pyruvate,water dikinase